MTDDNMIKNNREVTAAPPEGEASFLRARDLAVVRWFEAVIKAPQNRGSLQHVSSPAQDGGDPKAPLSMRVLGGQREITTKVVNMREHNHGRVGVTHTGASDDGRESTRP